MENQHRIFIVAYGNMYAKTAWRAEGVLAYLSTWANHLSGAQILQL